MTNPFYTSVRPTRDGVGVRGVDENGQRFTKTVNFQPYYFLKTSEPTGYKTLSGHNARRVELDSVQQVKRQLGYWQQTCVPVHGDVPIQNMFINDAYPGNVEFDIEKILTYNIDIETTCENGFPDIMNPQEEVTVITLYHSILKKFIVMYNQKFGEWTSDEKFSAKYGIDIQKIPCADEKALLMAFVDLWSIDYPDIVTGWNIAGFDIPYLVARITAILHKETTNRLSPWGFVTERTYRDDFGNDKIGYTIHGVEEMDYLALYKKFTFKMQESYKLDNIAYVELGENKLSYDEYGSLHLFYMSDFSKFIDYNVKDVLLVFNLDKKLKLIELALLIAYRAKVNYPEVFSPVKTWDGLVYTYLWEKNIVVPPKPEREEERGSYEGAYVKVPTPGLYNWVVSFDVNSLYPSIIMQHNISPETLQSTKPMKTTIDELVNKEWDLSFLQDNDLTMTANGRMYTRKIQGVIPALMEDIYKGRKAYKRKMLEEQQRLENIDALIKKREAESNITKDDPLYEEREVLVKSVAKLNGFQHSYKILLNSGYGAYASPYFRYYNAANAEAITLTGQLVIRTAEHYIDKFMSSLTKVESGKSVIAADTDSLYITVDEIVKKIKGLRPNITIDEVVTTVDKFCNGKIQDVLSSTFEDLGVYLNAVSQKIEMKREVIADVGFWKAKKRYMLNVYDSEGVRLPEPKIKITGLQSASSATPEVCRNAMKKLFKLVLTATEDDVIDFIEDFKQEFLDLDPEQIAFPKNVSYIDKYLNARGEMERVVDKDTGRTAGIPIQSRGSIHFNRLIDKHGLGQKYPKIRQGEKVKYVYLKMPNMIMDDVIAFSTTLPTEFGLHSSIDYLTQFKKSFLDPVHDIMEVLNWNTSETNGLGNIITIQ